MRVTPRKGCLILLLIGFVGIIALVAVIFSSCVNYARGDGRECFETPPELLESIAEGNSGVKISPVAGAAVESKEPTAFRSTVFRYIVAMKFSAPGVSDQIGVWSTANLDEGSNMILAMDPEAQTFTHWPAQMYGRRLTEWDDGVKEARTCLDRVLKGRA